MNPGSTHRDQEYEEILTVLRDSKTPLYHQIFLILRGKILDNTYPRTPSSQRKTAHGHVRRLANHGQAGA